LLIFAGFLMFAFTRPKAYFTDTLKWIFPLFIFTLLALIYELIKTQGPSYYYYKLEVLLLLMMAVPALSALLHLIIKRFDFNSLFPRLGLLIIILGSIFIAGFNLNFTSTTLRQTLGSARELHAQEANIIDNYSLVNSYSSKNARLYFIFPQDKARGIISTHLARLSHPETHCDDVLFADIYSASLNNFADNINRCVSTEPNHYFIYTDPSTLPSLQELIKTPNTQKSQLTISAIN
jgi:hypothetical protein